MTSDRTVGRVEYFLSTKLNNDEFQIVCVMCQMAPRGDGRYSPPSGSMVVTSDEIVGAVMWSEDQDGFRIIPPPITATWSAA